MRHCSDSESPNPEAHPGAGSQHGAVYMDGGRARRHQRPCERPAPANPSGYHRIDNPVVDATATAKIPGVLEQFHLTMDEVNDKRSLRRRVHDRLARSVASGYLARPGGRPEGPVAVSPR